MALEPAGRRKNEGVSRCLAGYRPGFYIVVDSLKAISTSRCRLKHAQQVNDAVCTAATACFSRRICSSLPLAISERGSDASHSAALKPRHQILLSGGPLQVGPVVGWLIYSFVKSTPVHTAGNFKREVLSPPPPPLGRSKRTRAERHNCRGPVTS